MDGVHRLPRGKALILLPLLISLGCDDAPDPSGPAALVQTWVEMWNSYDLDQVEGLFLNDDRLTYFSSEREGVIRGFQGVLEHHRGFGFVPGGLEQGTRLWVEDLWAHVFEEAAVLTGIWFFQRSGEAEPSTDPQRGPVTFVCVHEDGAWRFVHMNFGEYLPPETTNP
jgi:hypothetical protein